MNRFGFLIAACLRNEDHSSALTESIESIQQFYPELPIVVICDFTSDPMILLKFIVKFPTVRFETDTPKVPADMLLLYFFKKNHYFEKGILIQDSMKVISRVELENTTALEYLWHFTNHRVHWHIIDEPQTEYNRLHNIKTHDDLIEHCIETLITKPEYQKYCREIYRKKELWSGCFGCLCILDYDMLCKLDEKCGIIELMSHMKDNRLRRAIESLFSLACQFVLEKEIHTSFDGLYYNGTDYHNEFKGKMIEKKSFNRQ